MNEPQCKFGHICTSGCQKDFDCPCQSEHNCDVTIDKVCDECGGDGTISVMEQVYPGEPHMADVGSRPCPSCQAVEPDDMSGASEGDR